MSGASLIAAIVCSAVLSSCGNGPDRTADADAARETPSSLRAGRAAKAVTLPAGSPSPSPSPTSSAIGGTLPITCPVTIGSLGTLARGVRRLGNSSVTDLPLTDASIATIAPADYDPEAGNLSESEADDIEGDVNVTGAVFSYSPTLPAVSLVCRYGKSIQPLSAEAMLMIPLKPQWARCRYVAAQAGRQASMTCNRMKPVE